MAKKKSAKASGDLQRRKRAATKAHVKSLQKTHKKLQTELKKFEKGLASPLLVFHNL
jgi:ABC-type phosphate transport system auxiliary subunit